MARVRIFQRLVPLRRDTVQRLEGNKKASHEDRYLQEECSRKSVSSVAQSCLTLCDPWTAALQASLSINNSWSLLRLMSVELVMPSNRLTLCRPLLLLPSIFPSIRVFSSESVLCIRWPRVLEFQLQHQFFQ